MCDRIRWETDELNTKRVTKYNVCLISVSWIFSVVVGFWMEMEYLNDPSWDFDDEHENIFRIVKYIWFFLQCKSLLECI